MSHEVSDQPSISSQVTYSRWLPWWVVFCASLFFFYEFIQMNMFNTINSYLMKTFEINAVSMGYVTAAYFYADVLFLFPAGMLLDRFSSRRIILLAMLVCIVSTVLLANSHSIVMIAIYHFAAGIGNAFCFLSCARLASRWFSPRQMALVIGLIVTMAFLGGMVAQTPLSWLVAKIGWRHALWITALLGVIIMGMVALWVYDSPPGTQAQQGEEQAQLKALGFWPSVRATLLNRQNWTCGFYTSFMNLPLMLLGGAWGKMYLTTTTSVSNLEASNIAMMLFFGSMIGCPLIGWLSDHFACRRLPMLIFALFSLPIMLLIIYGGQHAFTALLVLFFLLGLFTAAQTVAYPAIAENNPKAMTGTAMGLASVFIMGGPAVFDPLFGWIMDKTWEGKMLHGAPIYSPSSFHAAMLTLPVMLLVAVVMALLIRETYARQMVE